jgi:hypothetical protein
MKSSTNLQPLGWTKREGDPSQKIMEIWKLLEACGSEAEATTRNLEAHLRSLWLSKESYMGWDEALQRGLIIGIKMAQFNVTRNLEDKRTTLERVGMAAKWNSDQK